MFDDRTPAQLIRAVRPDVLVKGADYRKDEVVGAEFVETYGGRVHLATLHDGFSTTTLIQKMQAA
ncbi:Bifunctional protein HldE [compost metagenome]